MAKKRKRYTKKTRGRMIVIFLFFGSIICTLGYTLIINLNQINDMNRQREELNKEKSILKEEEESLKSDIEKLSDDEYIARYAREKYFYSKKGELVLRIED